MVTQLAKYFDKKYTLINAHVPSDEIVQHAFQNLQKNNKFTAVSQIAICYSHLECIKNIYENKLEFGAVIEDDIHLRDDFKELLQKYVNNSPEVIREMRTEPCIIHLVSSPSHNQKLYQFTTKPIVSNICFYVINHMMAKIILDNAFPLSVQFDQYIHLLVPKYKLKEYVACPIMGWDLSSSIYNNFHTKEDIENKKYIKNESNNIKIKK
jgi:GR25 family glycosyltransferase involved in LPS biosynthesis